MILISLLIEMLYLYFLLGCEIGLATTNFVPAKGFWRLIPLRVSGWKSPFTNEVIKINWVFEDPRR